MRKLLMGSALFVLVLAASASATPRIGPPMYRPNPITFVMDPGEASRRAAIGDLRQKVAGCMDGMVVQPSDRIIDLDKRFDDCVRAATDGKAFMIPRFGTGCTEGPHIQICTAVPMLRGRSA